MSATLPGPPHSNTAACDLRWVRWKWWKWWWRWGAGTRTRSLSSRERSGRGIRRSSCPRSSRRADTFRGISRRSRPLQCLRRLILLCPKGVVRGGGRGRPPETKSWQRPCFAPRFVPLSRLAIHYPREPGRDRYLVELQLETRTDVACSQRNWPKTCTQSKSSSRRRI